MFHRLLASSSSSCVTAAAFRRHFDTMMDRLLEKEEKFPATKAQRGRGETCEIDDL